MGGKFAWPASLYWAHTKTQVFHPITALYFTLHSEPCTLHPAPYPRGVHETLVSYSQSKGADLVVVGTRGLGSIHRSMLSLAG